MGTRSLTRFFQNEKEIACVYQQFDGYPQGAGKQIADFLKSGVMVNGIPGGSERYFNGMGCLAAQYVAQHKSCAGNIYLYAPGSKDCGEEYTYEIHGGHEAGTYQPKPLTVKCEAKYLKPFSGSVSEFVVWCEKGGEEEEAA